MSYFDSKHLRAAKALSAKDWAHPKVLLVARHMGKAGATPAEIRAAIWPDVTIGCVVMRLKRLNIPHGAKTKRAKLGEQTSLPDAERCRIDYRAYRPREVSR